MWIYDNPITNLLLSFSGDPTQAQDLRLTAHHTGLDVITARGAVFSTPSCIWLQCNWENAGLCRRPRGMCTVKTLLLICPHEMLMQRQREEEEEERVGLYNRLPYYSCCPSVLPLSRAACQTSTVLPRCAFMLGCAHTTESGPRRRQEGWPSLRIAQVRAMADASCWNYFLNVNKKHCGFILKRKKKTWLCVCGLLCANMTLSQNQIQYAS